MRKLTHNEGNALLILAKRGSLVPGDSVPDWSAAGLMEALNGLVKKNRATVTNTDDGRHSISPCLAATMPRDAFMRDLIRDCAWWLFCWACWRAYTWGPWSLMSGEFGMRLLPFAGLYAYSATWADFRECIAWNAAGRPRA